MIPSKFDRVAIVQLSDLHVSDASDANMYRERAQRIADSIAGSITLEVPVVLLYNGDLANTGSSSEYRIFIESFHKHLVSKLESHGLNIVSVCATPGNHDLDHSQPYENRTNLILAQPSPKNLSSTAYTNCTDPIVNYLSFMSDEKILTVNTNGCSASFMIEMSNECKLELIMVNSALYCNKSDYGNLGFPYLDLKKELDSTSDVGTVRILAMHHSLVWFNTDTQRALRDLLAKSVHIVCAGHDHESNHLGMTLNANVVEILESGPVLDSRFSVSHYNIILLDAGNRTATVRSYRLNDRNFRYDLERTERTLEISRMLSAKDADLVTATEELQRLFDDVGLPIKHPNKTQLLLSDVFVHPRMSLGDGDYDDSDTLKRHYVSYNTVKEKKYFVLTGESHSGKSAFLRHLCREKYGDDMYPVFLKSSQIATQRTDIDRIVADEVNRYYRCETSAKAYDRIPASKIVVAIDDVHRSIDSAQALGKSLEEIHSKYGGCILTIDSTWASTTAYRVLMSNISSYEQVVLQPMSKQEISALVYKWSRINQPVDVEQEKTLKENIQIADQVAASRLVPLYPFYFLAALSLNTRQLSDGSTSYVHIYESLVSDATKRVFTDTSERTMFVHFIASLAFKLARKGILEFSENEVRHLAADHQQRTGITVEYTRMIEGMRAAGIIDYTEGQYRFHYRYTYYYLVAHHIKVTDDAESREYISECIETMERESSTVVLSFILQNGYSEDIVSKILEKAGSLYATDKELEIQSDMDSIFGVYAKEIDQYRLSLSESNVIKMRSGESTGMDGAQSIQIESSDDTGDGHQVEEMLYTMKLSLSIIDILTSVCRSQIGVWDSANRERILGAITSLSLRATGAMIRQQTEAASLLISLIRDEIVKSGIDESLEIERELRRETTGMVLTFVRGMIRRAASAYGTKIGQQVAFAGIEKNGIDTARGMIYYSGVVDHGRTINAQVLNLLRRGYKELSYVGKVMVKMMTYPALHYNLLEAGRQVQAICQLIGIKYTRIQQQSTTRYLSK